jgi:hypothetical protein
MLGKRPGDVVAMSANDEKISANRRRLFKALSAAPVVLTLRPGSALANTSIVQCLEDGFAAEIGSEDFLPTGSLCRQGDTNNCFAYKQLYYWEVPEQAPTATAFCGDDLRGAVIVEVDPVAGLFMTTEGEVVSSRVVKNGVNLTIHHGVAPYHGMLSAGKRMLAPGQQIATDLGGTTKNKPAYHGMLVGGKKTEQPAVQEMETVCYENVQGKLGFFKQYAGTLKDPKTGVAIAYDPENVETFPLRTLNSDAGYQGINQSCLMSSDPAAVSKFTFVRG